MNTVLCKKSSNFEVMYFASVSSMAAIMHRLQRWRPSRPSSCCRVHCKFSIFWLQMLITAVLEIAAPVIIELNGYIHVNFCHAQDHVWLYVCIVLAFNSFIFFTHITYVKVTRDHVREKIAHESRNGFTIYKNQLHKKPNQISRPHFLNRRNKSATTVLNKQCKEFIMKKRVFLRFPKKNCFCKQVKTPIMFRRYQGKMDII